MGGQTSYLLVFNHSLVCHEAFSPPAPHHDNIDVPGKQTRLPEYDPV